MDIFGSHLALQRGHLALQRRHPVLQRQHHLKQGGELVGIDLHLLHLVGQLVNRPSRWESERVPPGPG